MKKVLLLVLLMSSCSLFNTNPGREVDVEHFANSANFEVTLLFEIDGCKVYRFTDARKYRYFLTGNGRPVVSNYNEGTQKVPSYQDDFVSQ